MYLLHLLHLWTLFFSFNCILSLVFFFSPIQFTSTWAILFNQFSGGVMWFPVYFDYLLLFSYICIYYCGLFFFFIFFLLKKKKKSACVCLSFFFTWYTTSQVEYWLVEYSFSWFGRMPKLVGSSKQLPSCQASPVDPILHIPGIYRHPACR